MILKIRSKVEGYSSQMKLHTQKDFNNIQYITTNTVSARLPYTQTTQGAQGPKPPGALKDHLNRIV